MAAFLLPLIYIAFISLGLPDPLLGSAWPTIYPEMNVPVSYAGIISTIIAVGTVVSSLLSDRLTKKMGTGMVTAVSVTMTAFALFGFSVSGSFIMLCLMAVPYGLGAGGVDASLNNYVALHYESRHMSWLHCFWGVGTVIGPYIMGFVLTRNLSWNMGYRYVFFLQIVLAAILFLSLPLWKKNDSAKEKDARPLTFKEIFSLAGIWEVLLMFFCYCAIEQTALLWSGTYLVENWNVAPEKAASLASMFCIGITAGRFVSGFLTMKFDDEQMIRIGQAVIGLGVLLMALPLGGLFAMAGLILIGLGCAPIYPSVIHSTPRHFGEENSQAVIGVQMAAAYVGTCLAPPLFGFLGQKLGMNLLPFYILLFLLLNIVEHEKLVKKT